MEGTMGRCGEPTSPREVLKSALIFHFHFTLTSPHLHHAKMASTLLKPTLHVEVEIVLKGSQSRAKIAREVCRDISDHIKAEYASVQVGQHVKGFGTPG